MKQTKTNLLEQVSALADGQLDDEEFGHVMTQARQAEHAAEVQATWQRYHLIGDVLRSGRQEACTDSSAFMQRLQRRLALEPLKSPPPLPVAAVEPRLLRRLEAANEPVFRWKLVAGVASLAAAMAIGWNWVGNGSALPGAQLAQAQPSQPGDVSVLAVSGPSGAATSWGAGASTTVAVDSVAPQTMLRNARLDELLAAHRQAAGGLQPSVFLRNATFEGPSR